MKHIAGRKIWTALILVLTLALRPGAFSTNAAVFNVKHCGASGRKADDARPAIQQAIDACAAAGGGTVLLPAGEYTSGTLHLRSRIRLEIAAGATLFASPDPKAYDHGGIPSKAALLMGEGLDEVTIAGAGTVDGQAEYEWREDDFETGFDHKEMMQKRGKSLMRSFPKGFPQREVYPHLVWLGRSRDVRFTGLQWLHSPSWTLALWECQRARFDGLYIYTSLKEGVWADGIDLDGCTNVVIRNCRIETGDDCIALISSDNWGPARVCEDITVTRCRLSSTSAGVKFSEGNRIGIRHVRVSDCVLTNVNRGFVFLTTLGGDISDVVLADLTIHCQRSDWFWAGDGQPFHFRPTRLSELTQEPAKPGEAAPGAIRRITIRNVTAHAKGTSRFLGHAENWLDQISLEDMTLFLTTDPAAPFDIADHALDFRRVRNLQLRNVAVAWGQPALATWKNALYLEAIRGLELDGFAGRGAGPDQKPPVVALHNVADATVRRSRAGAGSTFLKFAGPESRAIRVQGNDFRRARIPLHIEDSVPADAIQMRNNRLPPPGTSDRNPLWRAMSDPAEKHSSFGGDAVAGTVGADILSGE